MFSFPEILPTKNRVSFYKSSDMWTCVFAIAVYPPENSNIPVPPCNLFINLKVDVELSFGSKINHVVRLYSAETSLFILAESLTC
jgi:hypothetical protein